VLARALAASGLAPRIDRRCALQSVRNAWAAAVGPQLAARSRPAALRGGELHVLVIDHRWRDQIDAARSMVLERLNAQLGRPAVRALRFGLAHGGFLECDAPVARAARPPVAARIDAAAWLPGELREAFLRAAGASLRR